MKLIQWLWEISIHWGQWMYSEKTKEEKTELCTGAVMYPGSQSFLHLRNIFWQPSLPLSCWRMQALNIVRCVKVKAWWLMATSDQKDLNILWSIKWAMNCAALNTCLQFQQLQTKAQQIFERGKRGREKGNTLSVSTVKPQDLTPNSFCKECEFWLSP